MTEKRPSFYARIKRPYGRHRYFGQYQYQVIPLGFSLNGVALFWEKFWS